MIMIFLLVLGGHNQIPNVF